MQLTSFFKLQGMSEDEARDKIYLVDSQGLVYDGRGALAEHKKSKTYLCLCATIVSVLINLSPVFSRKDYHGPPMKNLVEIIDYVKPTALLGLSTIKVRSSPSIILVNQILINLGRYRARSTNPSSRRWQLSTPGRSSSPSRTPSNCPSASSRKRWNGRTAGSSSPRALRSQSSSTSDARCTLGKGTTCMSSQVSLRVVFVE